MSDTEYTWVALSIAGLALTSVALLLSDGIPSVIGYSFLTFAMILGLLTVWRASRGNPHRKFLPITARLPGVTKASLTADPV